MEDRAMDGTVVARHASSQLEYRVLGFVSAADALLARRLEKLVDSMLVTSSQFHP
jgi:hypothetical protein